MTKKEKKELLNEYKSLLIFTSDMRKLKDSDKIYYKGKMRQLEDVLTILNIEYNEFKKEIQTEYKNLDQEVNKFINQFK